MTPKAIDFPIVDFLAEEEARLTVNEITKARKAGKKERVKKLLKNIVASQPEPVVDFLAFGD